MNKSDTGSSPYVRPSSALGAHVITQWLLEPELAQGVVSALEEQIKVRLMAHEERIAALESLLDVNKSQAQAQAQAQSQTSHSLTQLSVTITKTPLRFSRSRITLPFLSARPLSRSECSLLLQRPLPNNTLSYRDALLALEALQELIARERPEQRVLCVLPSQSSLEEQGVRAHMMSRTQRLDARDVLYVSLILSETSSTHHIQQKREPL